MIKRLIRSFADRALRPMENRILATVEDRARTSAQTKIGQRHLFEYYRQLVTAGTAPRLSDTGFRCFSQFEEDGKLLFIFAALGVPTGTFVDIGAADGVNSNCANLALNFGWAGLFIDGNPNNVRAGTDYYRTHADTWSHPPKFVEARVTRDNINKILGDAAVPAEIDLLSIDIDGNDYWVWDAIACTSAKVVIIETQVLFGTRDLVVPYDPDHVHPGRHEDYYGASVTAMARLANAKGYRLVGSNDNGINTIYVRNGIGERALPPVPPDATQGHPHNAALASRFNAIKDWEYVRP